MPLDNVIVRKCVYSFFIDTKCLTDISVSAASLFESIFKNCHMYVNILAVKALFVNGFSAKLFENCPKEMA